MAERDSHAAATDDWGVSWEGHRRAQLTRALAATPAQRLAWLEEMLALAYRIGALPPLDADAAGSRAAREARRRGT
jgi:hypothetical protein